jgi:two-component system, response regulator RegA
VSTILLVDDEPSYRLTLSVLFEEEGFEVDVAASFAEAAARLDRECSYDLVMLDHHLGDGRGVDLIPMLRARLPRVKVMLVSGSSNGDTTIPSGVDSVVSKGFVFPELLTRVRELLA